MLDGRRLQSNLALKENLPANLLGESYRWFSAYPLDDIEDHFPPAAPGEHTQEKSRFGARGH